MKLPRFYGGLRHVLRIAFCIGIFVTTLGLGPLAATGQTDVPPAAGSVAASDFLNSLTEAERAWLRAHPVIRVAQDPSWPPIEFADAQGAPTGMTADYLQLIEARLGLKLERVKNLSWQEAYARMKRWEIDLTTTVAVTPERETFWAFTKPYMTIPIVIVTRAEVTYVADLRELEGRKVVVVDGYVANTWIARDFPAIQLVRVNTTEEALALVHSGEVFACVENMLVVGHYLAEMKITNLKIAGNTPYTNAQCMAVRKDWAPLAGILDRALDSITQTEREAIYRKWLPLRYEHGFDLTRFLPLAALVSISILALLAWRWGGKGRDVLLGVGSLRPWQAYLFAMVATVATFGLRLALDGPLGGRPTLVIFTLPIMVSAYLGGLRAGLLATAITFFGASYYLLPPLNSLAVTSHTERWQQFFIVLAGVFISVLSELLHRSRRRADRAIREHREADISAQAALKETLDLRAALDEHAIVAITDPQGRITYVNDKFCTISGYSRPELLGQDHRLINSGHHSKEYIRELWKTIRQGKVWHGEIKNKAKDGSLYWVDTTLVPFLDVAGKPRQYVAIRADITERKRGEDALRESEERFAAFMRHAPVAAWIVSEDSRVVYANPVFAQLFGKTPAELEGKGLRELWSPEFVEQYEANNRAVLASGRPVETVETSPRPGGDTGTFLAIKFPIPASSGQRWVGGAAIDITERKAHEVEIERLTRLYAALSQINQAIVMTTSREGLLQRVCQVLVEHGGLRMAWIGWHDSDHCQLLPVAASGDENGFLQRIRIPTDARPEGRGPTAAAFREGRAHICNDIDPATLPWRAEAERRGLRAFAAFPIREQEVTCGVITVYSNEAGFFRDKEIALLEEAAVDVSFALDNLQREAARQRAEQARRSSEQLFSKTFAHATVGMALVAPDGRFMNVNRALCRMLGYDEAELQALTFRDVTFTEDLDDQGRVQRLLAGEIESYQWEKRYRHREGHVVNGLLGVSLLRDEAGRPVCLIAQIQDITERKQAEWRARRLADSNVQGVMFWNKHGAISEANDAFLRLVGYTREDLTEGRINWAAMTPPEYAELDQRGLEHVAATGVCPPFEKEYIRKDGTRVPILIGAAAMEDGPNEGVCFVLDITERKQAEAANLRALQRLTEAQRIGRIGDWEFDLATSAITWSPETFAILGRDPALGPPRNYEENAALYEPASAALMSTKVTAAIASGESQEYELVALRPDGARVSMQARAVPRKDAAGRVVGLHGTLQDITDQKRQIEALRVSEERLSFAMGAAEIGDWDLDLRTNVARRSLRHAQCFGYTEMLPKWGYDNFLAHVDPSDRSRVDASFQKAMAGHGTFDEKFRVSWPDGSVHWLWSKGRFYFDETGQPYRVAGIVTDVTERRQAEVAAALLAAIVASSDDAIIGKDLRGIITSWNDGAERVFGYAAREMIGTSVLRLIPPDRHGEEVNILKTIKEGKALRTFETVRQSKDGRLIDVSITISPIKDAAGQIIGASKIVRDITQRKQAEAALAAERDRNQALARRLLEVRETERRQIARDLHDELGQLLTALKISLQTLQPTTGGTLAPCVVLADRALQQTRSISLALRPPLLDDLGLVPALRWLVDQQARQAGCQITLAADSLPDRPAPAIETACFRLAQEAVTNALRHARADLITVELLSQGGDLRLTVRDNGPGFDLTAARARALRGGSLGLLGMEERAALAGGRVKWQTAPGHGTTVQAWFPLSPAPFGCKDTVA